MNKIKKIAMGSIKIIFNDDLYEDLKEQEENEEEVYRAELKQFVNTL